MDGYIYIYIHIHITDGFPPFAFVNGVRVLVMLVWLFLRFG